LIIVDGGSTDTALEIIKKYEDPRIKVYNQPANSGRLPGALNIGFSYATGDFFTWTQDDDFFKEDAIEKMVSFLVKNSDVGLVYAGIWFIDDNGSVIGESELLPPESLITTNSVGHCFLYRREVAEGVGEYDVDYVMVEDVEFWMRVYKRFKVARMDGRYYYHRYHDGSLTIKNYGGHFAQRRLADASRAHFGISWFKYQRRIAEVFIDEAFLAFNKMDYKHVLPCLLSGIVRNPLWLGNKGLYSIGLQSLFKSLRVQ
jgi:glycosyltransferase involved in cell wall biosynthesis